MMDLFKELWADVGAYIWFICIALFGGTANYVSKVKANNEKAFSVVELVGEWFLSGFSGLITAYVCIAQGWSFELTAACSGIAGHMGGRGVYIIEQYIIDKLLVHKKK